MSRSNFVCLASRFGRRGCFAAILLFCAAAASAGASGPYCLSTEAPLNSNARTDSGGDFNPRAAFDSLGHGIAVWKTNDTLGGAIGTEGDILFARSSDFGATWGAPAPLNTNAATDTGMDEYPRIVTNGAGVWLAVWGSYDTLGGTIGSDLDVVFSRSTDNGLTWSAPKALNSDAGSDPSGSFPKDDFLADLVTDGAGVWVCAWAAKTNHGSYWDAEIRVSRSLDDGVTWSPYTLVFHSNTFEFPYPSIHTDGHGTYIIGWKAKDSLGGTIGTDDDDLFSRSTDNGVTWSAAAPLNTDAAADGTYPDLDPEVCSNGQVWIAAWQGYEPLGAGAYGTDTDILYARSLDGGITWSYPKVLTPRMSSDSYSDAYPSLAADAQGRLFCAWEAHYTAGGGSNGSSIYLAISEDDGASWTELGVVNPLTSADNAYSGICHVTPCADGSIFVSWQSYDTLGGTVGGDADIFYAKVSLCPTPSPTPSATPTPTLTPSPTLSPSPTLTPPPTLTPTPAETASLTPSPTPTPACPEGPSSAALQGFLVEFLGAAYDSVANRTTFNYRVTGLGSPPALSHWVLGLGSCSVVTASPQPYVLGLDPRTHVTGIKWEEPLQPNQSMLYSVTVAGQAVVGSVEAAVKAGPRFQGAPLAGPRCDCSPGGDPLAQTIPMESQGVAFSEGGDMGGEWVGGVIDLNPHASLAADSPTTASATVELGGLCMSVPAAGDQIVAWYSSGNPIQLVDGAVYRVTFDATTDQAAENAIPLLDMFYDNFTGGIGPAYGGSAWFLDVAGGAEGIGRAQGRSSYTVYLAPNALLTPQWRGLLGGGAFTPEADPYKNMRIGFRLLDLGSAGYNAAVDAGTICVGNMRVETFNADSLPVDATLYDAPISNNTHAPFALGQAPHFAQIDDAAHIARYQLDASADRATLLPALDLDPPNRVYDLSSLYPVAWESNTLYRVTASIQLAADASGASPLDAIFINVDTPTVELGQTNFTVCGVPNYFRFAASPRKAADAGGPQSYVAFFYGQNASLANGAARLRPLVDLFNTADYNGVGSGGDPLEVLGLKVDRLRQP